VTKYGRRSWSTPTRSVARGDFSRFFTDDAQASTVGTPQRATGAEAVEQMIRFMHEVAFDARPELKNMLV
jgi:hypothetical protein